MNKFLFTILFSIVSTAVMAQVSQPRQSYLRPTLPADSLSYLNPKDYIIGGISVTEIGRAHV